MSRGDCSVDDQYSGQSAAHVAAQNGHIDVLRYLMQHNANMEEEGASICFKSVYFVSVCMFVILYAACPHVHVQCIYLSVLYVSSMSVRTIISGIFFTKIGFLLKMLLL